MLKQLSLIDSSVEREHYLKYLSEKYDLSIETLHDEIHVLRQKQENHKDRASRSDILREHRVPVFKHKSFYQHFKMLKDSYSLICCKIRALLIGYRRK